jgi:hypothetical protein
VTAEDKFVPNARALRHADVLGDGRKAPRILNLGTRRPLYPQINNTGSHCVKGWARPHSRSRSCSEEKNPALPGIEPQSPIQCLITILTELPRPFIWRNKYVKRHTYWKLQRPIRYHLTSSYELEIKLVVTLHFRSKIWSLLKSTVQTKTTTWTFLPSKY